MASAKEQDVLAFLENPTEDNRQKIHACYIPSKYRDEVAARLPEDMHINDKVVRYRNGMNPRSQANLKPEEVGFKPGVSGNPTGKNTGKRLQSAYRQALEQPWEVTFKNGTTQKKHFSTAAQAMTEMHLFAMRDAFEKKNWSMFNRLATDFRLSAGEIPTQEKEIRQESTVNHVLVLPVRDNRVQIEEAQFKELKDDDDL